MTIENIKIKLEIQKEKTKQLKEIVEQIESYKGEKDVLTEWCSACDEEIHYNEIGIIPHDCEETTRIGMYPCAMCINNCGDGICLGIFCKENDIHATLVNEEGEEIMNKYTILFKTYFKGEVLAKNDDEIEDVVECIDNIGNIRVNETVVSEIYNGESLVSICDFEMNANMSKYFNFNKETTPKEFKRDTIENIIKDELVYDIARDELDAIYVNHNNETWKEEYGDKSKLEGLIETLMFVKDKSLKETMEYFGDRYEGRFEELQEKYNPKPKFTMKDLKGDINPSNNKVIAKIMELSPDYEDYISDDLYKKRWDVANLNDGVIVHELSVVAGNSGIFFEMSYDAIDSISIVNLTEFDSLLEALESMEKENLIRDAKQQILEMANGVGVA